MIDATDLESAMDFVRANKGATAIRVDKRGFCRIRREISRLHLICPAPYPRMGLDIDKLLWRECRFIMRRAEVRVYGVTLKL